LDFNYPIKIDNNGRTQRVNEDEHIRQLIEQVLFTSLGERVNRPTFGSGINQLVFGTNDDELASTVQFLVQGSLQQWLGDLIKIEAVAAESRDSAIYVTVQYSIIRSQEKRTHEFVKET
jgi:phage baseplate assembly protein W